MNSKFLMRLHVGLAAYWAIIGIRMLVSDYTPPRWAVFGMVVILMLEALIDASRYRLRYWRERLDTALKESESL